MAGVSEKDKKPGLREQIGVAVNRGTDVALSKAAALGAATLVLPKEPLPEPAPAKWHDRRRLAEVLWRMKYGDDRVAGREATMLFAWWLRRHPMIAQLKIAPDSRLLLHFAGRVLVEWWHDRCGRCGGTGFENLTPAKSARNVHRTKVCPDCHGVGKPGIDRVARANALGVPMLVYEKHWAKRFGWAHDAINPIVGSMPHPLASQLGRRRLAFEDEQD